MTCGMALGLELEALRRVYRTRELSDGVHVEDLVRLDVVLLPVLEDAAMRDALRAALREKGWTDGADGSMQKQLGEAVATLSPDGRSIGLRTVADATVTVEGRAVVEGEGGEKKADREAEKDAREKLAQRTEAERSRLAEKNLGEIARREPELRAEVQQALNRTYRLALEERARQLGEIESLQERGDTGGTYEVTVVVKA